MKQSGCKSIWVNPRNLPAAESERVLGKAIEHEYNLGDLLRRPDVSYADADVAGRRQVRSRAVRGTGRPAEIEQIEIAAKYSGYIDRQQDEVERAAHFENLKLPADLDYMQVPALSFEVRQKLDKHRPETLGLASRISGVTPAAISLLLVHLRKGGHRAFAETRRRSRARSRPNERQVDRLREGAAALGLDAERSAGASGCWPTATLILKWNKVYNLTAVRDPATVLTHHLLDSLAVVAAAAARSWPAQARACSTSAPAPGLPGVVIAICAPTSRSTCVDAVAKKAAFVQQVAAELELPNLRGVHARVETLAGAATTSSAPAPLPRWRTSSPGRRSCWRPEGVWMAMKGKVPGDELAALPPGVDVFHVEQLAVPGLDAERCIVWARKAAA